MKFTRYIFCSIFVSTTFAYVIKEYEISNDTIDYNTIENKKSEKLILLHVLFRHGNRAIDEGTGYAKDPYANETYYPIGFGQLTTLGKQRIYKIGKYLREKYNDFLGPQYTPDVLYARSTNYKRTKATLELVLASLYPPTAKDKFVENLNWQPIPYLYKTENDYELYSPLICTDYLRAYYQYCLSDEAQAKIEPYRNLYAKLSNYTGNKIKLPSDVLNIYLTLLIESEWGLTLPSWTKGLFPEVLELAAALTYEFQTATATLKRLAAGFLLRKILDDTQAKIDGILDEDRKIFLYSAHELNIGYILRTLNVYYPHVPPYGATIFFEVHEIRGVYGFKFYYQDYISTSPKLLTIPGCKAFCPVSQLYHLLKDYFPLPDDCVTTNEH